MLRLLRLAWVMFVVQLKRRLAYRGDLLIQSLDELLRGLIALAMLLMYTRHTRSIAGYTADDLLFILGFSLVPISLFHCLCGNLYQVSSRYILDGQLDRILLRPYPPVLQICFDRLSIEDLGGAVLGTILMAVAAQSLDIAWSPLLIAKLLLLLAIILFVTALLRALVVAIPVAVVAAIIVPPIIIASVVVPAVVALVLLLLTALFFDPALLFFTALIVLALVLPGAVLLFLPLLLLLALLIFFLLFAAVFFLFLTTLLAGCSTPMKPEDFANSKPRFVLEDYFTGKTKAWGMFTDRFGNLKRQFGDEVDLIAGNSGSSAC